MSNVYQWQADVIHGLKKGELHIVSMGRQSGKSMFWKHMRMQEIIFTGSYTDWKKFWTWPWNRKTSVYGKKIWGKINSRYCRLSINRDGSRPTQYATDKEVFKKLMKDGRGW